MPVPRDNNDRILRDFLCGKGYTYRPPAPPHETHDGWACIDGQPKIELELTRYIVDAARKGGSPQLAAVEVWNQKLWPLINHKRRCYPDLRRVYAKVEFKSVFPRQFEILAKELAACCDEAWRQRNTQCTLFGRPPQLVKYVFGVSI